MGIRQKIEQFLHPFGQDSFREDLAERSVEYQRLALWFSLVIAVLMLVTAGFTAYVAYLTYSNTAIPNSASLAILPIENRDLIFGSGYMADNNPVSESIKLCVTNNGRKPSGIINFYWNSDWISMVNGQIKNLDGGHSDCVYMGVRTYISRSFVEGQEPIEESKMPPLGPNKLTLTVVCTYCDPPLIEDTYDVCIYGRGFEHSKCEELLKK